MGVDCILFVFYFLSSCLVWCQTKSIPSKTTTFVRSIMCLEESSKLLMVEYSLHIEEPSSPPHRSFLVIVSRARLSLVAGGPVHSAFSCKSIICPWGSDNSPVDSKVSTFIIALPTLRWSVRTRLQYWASTSAYWWPIQS